MDGLIRNTFAIVGAFAVVGMLKGIISLQEDVQFVVQAIQSVTRTIWSFVFRPLSFEVPSIIQDYLTMGVVTAGMQMRSSLYMWSAIQKEDWNEVIFSLPLFGKILIADQGEPKKFYWAILPLQMLKAFFFWPLRIISSTWLYKKGRWKRNFDGDKWDTKQARRVSKQQYKIFFETLLWAFIIIVINYALFFTERN